MNDEDFVSFEQAVKLKACGFDWLCFTFFDLEISDEYVCISGKEMANEDCDESEILCPSLALAAKWLREVKGIYVVVEPRFSNYLLLGYDWMIYDDCSGDYSLRAPLPFSRTHETALSAGIDAALEMIK